ncbi:MAG: neutral/alkaline non-lysosomal ceramidase N-terminal domain-containing protein [Planctomycetota bacterium]|jgi:hypothetical protein
MKPSILLTCVLLAACLSLLAPPSHADEAGALRIGVARLDITPEKPVTMAGYASRKDLSTGVHDPLSARVMVFELGDRRLVVVSTDLIGFYDGTTEYMREALLDEFDLEPSQLFLSAVHTHAGPRLGTNKTRAHPNNVEYTVSLKGKLIAVIREALANLQVAAIGVGTGSCPVGTNRRELRVRDNGESSIVLGRNPYGPTDKEVLVMKAATPDGRLLAVAFDYATHATCLGPKNYTISGDVMGLAEQFVEKVMGNGVIAPAFAGASGDIDPWFRILPSFETESGWVPEPVLMGTFLGEEVVHVCRRIDRTTSPGRIATAFAALELPPKPTEDAAERNANPAPFNVTVARVGDLAFVGLGGEVLTEIGMAIKAGSPCEYTFIITHCNGAAGYLAPKGLHVEGGYEIRSTRYAPQAADTVVRESVRMLHDL